MNNDKVHVSILMVALLVGLSSGAVSADLGDSTGEENTNISMEADGGISPEMDAYAAEDDASELTNRAEIVKNKIAGAPRRAPRRSSKSPSSGRSKISVRKSSQKSLARRSRGNKAANDRKLAQEMLEKNEDVLRKNALLAAEKERVKQEMAAKEELQRALHALDSKIKEKEESIAELEGKISAEGKKWFSSWRGGNLSGLKEQMESLSSELLDLKAQRAQKAAQ